ncbi:hypothetical protein lacNasYZ03_00490 [Lactobacillus nasalidis]|uniref:Uncharacterized protein n=1 Tax=Lactobacillus nasalidis TaxID=2797258 RepID=A0ABQ3W634_9LACO|nr:hypothetical protein [Lactobacillus nasalidis]GHV97933.1 hypothetical protein lacNasYZ01_11150 [Lactobacillus nasalidis]GHV99141.1 hypothetical protein lacNasYZ02_05710 [Lactobacillus nasalidis]GHW00362.1 hypothetical protein lacNasYZ03_00490 [Lactobacillus nasalidis]
MKKFQQKKWQQILRKCLCSLVALASLVALLSSPITFKMSDAKDYASSLIDQFASQNDDSAMTIAAKAAVESGLKEDLVDQLPNQVVIKESYLSLYRLVSRYRQDKRLQASDLNLPTKNKVQVFLGDLILYLVNSELKVHEGELQQITQIYQLSLWIICFLYLLGVALLIFDRYLAWLPLLLGAVGAFGFQVFMTHFMSQTVQEELYSKMYFTYSWGSRLGFILALLLAAYMIYGDVGRLRKKRQERLEKKKNA